MVIFIRRSSEAGTVSLLGRTFEVDALWPHRLVRCDMNLAAQTIRFHALRRREPHYQAFLHEAPDSFPRRRFVE
jgi:type IV secretory pathway VirD2 relaxase